VDFSELFRRATKHEPFPFQRRFAEAPELPNVLAAPTGAGKTATAVLGWLWRRRHAPPSVRGATPRRLVFCLPMRSLVTQTTGAAEKWLTRLGLDDVRVYALLGGAVDNSFDAHPDADTILVGTQDQLLSRALNRGYAVSRYRWPMQYALLNNDCLWVMDEIQLMGVGLSTTAQLDALRQTWATCGPTASVWMSATLDTRLLGTVDSAGRTLLTHAIDREDRQANHLKRRLKAPKVLTLRTDLFDEDEARYAKAVAAAVAEAHVEGTRTLVVMNRVARAQAVHGRLADHHAELLHSRYRPADRSAIEGRVLDDDWTGILVSTQAIEAGVDISSKTMFTELASWSSLVQRFGRCNRTGEWSESDPAHIHVLDLPAETKNFDGLALPYLPEELDRARDLVSSHESASPDDLDRGLPPKCEPAGPVVRRKDVFELFDTTPDLSGRDLDVSQWIRDTGQPTVQLAWRDFDGSPPANDPALHRDELCAVPLPSAAGFVKKAIKRSRDACWRWDSLEGAWQPVDGRLVPGRSYLLSREAGGYDPAIGWTARRTDRPPPVVPPVKVRQDDDAADRLTHGASSFVHLAQHSDEAHQACAELRALLPYALPWDTLVMAARWHDLGKAHEAFQEMLVSALPEDDPLRVGGPWAKSDGRPGGRRCQRPHFRHELASALAMIELGHDDLAAYLAASHHGKVRLAIRARPTEPRPADGRLCALGVQDGDVLPPVDLGSGTTAAGTTLRLDLMELGASGRPSWTMRALGLLEAWGPFRLALMETLVRVADWRASALHSRELNRD